MRQKSVDHLRPASLQRMVFQGDQRRCSGWFCDQRRCSGWFSRATSVRPASLNNASPGNNHKSPQGTPENNQSGCKTEHFTYFCQFYTVLDARPRSCFFLLQQCHVFNIKLIAPFEYDTVVSIRIFLKSTKHALMLFEQVSASKDSNKLKYYYSRSFIYVPFCRGTQTFDGKNFQPKKKTARIKIRSLHNCLNSPCRCALIT
jgi:hypothetical protein